MYTFKDKKNRDICLIPEVTAIIQDQFKTDWNYNRKKSMYLFYVSRCYRYERPQTGRYREFTQFGVEILGDKSGNDSDLIRNIAKNLVDIASIQNEFKESVKRGLDYYVEDGFEVECPSLGTQRQILGGGRYDCGVGFAVGIERLLLAQDVGNN